MTIVAGAIARPLGGEAWSISWTGTADRVVRVFVNGKLAYGPELVAAAAKSVTVSLPNPATVEVHENLDGETVDAAGVPLERRPLVWWREPAGAADSRIYVDDVLRAVVPVEPSLLHRERVLTQDVRLDGGAWRELRIEAVSSSGVETSSDAVPLYVPGVPPEPSAVTIAGSGGVFDIEVTP